MADKLSKASVNYRAAASARRRCGTCAMFRPGAEANHCTLVAGAIQPNHVCDRWEKKVARGVQ